MAEEARHRGLGRGLSALLGEGEVDVRGEPPRGVRTVPVAFLKPNPFQPRKNFRDEELRELADSIREKGILQPILVRPVERDSFEIVAGERRWRAAQMAQLHDVPVVVREVTDSEALELALVENLQRTDLNAMEEAAAYQELMDRFGHTQEQLSDLLGKSRSHVANTLRLLRLPESVQALIREGRLSAGHARTLIGASDPEAMAREIVAGALSVRAAERKARSPKRPGKPAQKDADIRDIEHKLSMLLGMNVQIADKGKQGGSIKIAYRTLEQLDDIIRRLSLSTEVD
ncbi:MAG: ParB/RepB/Spo0J family partition protein [Alphaproteobacteria bacterium]